MNEDSHFTATPIMVHQVVKATAIKCVIAHQIEKEMTERNISKSALARMMQTSRSSLDRLLDPENPSVTLLALESAALALGKKLKVQFG